MSEYQKIQVFGYMSAVDNDEMPDGARQAMLEHAAEQWGDDNGVDVDGFDAFMEYVQWKR
jgi:hypothetical protein